MRYPTTRHGALGLLLLLVTCAPATPPASQSAPPAAAPPTATAPNADGAPVASAAPALVTLNYGIAGILATYWVSFVGLNRGFFVDEGLNLDVVLTETSTRGGQLLIAGG